jgi:hypothetical protein
MKEHLLGIVIHRELDDGSTEIVDEIGGLPIVIGLRRLASEEVVEIHRATAV